jgi:ribosomal protein L12E/L44/L45/RPP1/RPP2
MKIHRVGACAVAIVLAITASCSDDPPSRGQVTDALVKSADQSGVDVDKACVGKVVAKFSDDDFKVVQASASKDNLDTEALSPAGQALLVDLYNCSGGDPGGTVPASGGLSTAQAAILEQMTSSLKAQGLDVDEDCLREIVKQLDSATIAGDSEALQAIGQQAIKCVKQP